MDLKFRHFLNTAKNANWAKLTLVSQKLININSFCKYYLVVQIYNFFIRANANFYKKTDGELPYALSSKKK